MFNFLPSGEILQQNGTNTEITQKNSSFNQQLEPMQVPNNGFRTSPVQQEEGAAQEGLRTLATIDPDNKDFGRVEEIATKAGSAAITNTPERAETGERQRKDIALEVKEVKQLNHVNLKLFLSPLNYNYHTLTVIIVI